MGFLCHAKTLACTILLLLGTMAITTIADCPDADIRCRIALADTGMTSTTSGCEGDASVTGTITGEVPSGSVTIGGKCYTTVTDSDNAQYLVVGVITIGQCYNALQGGCQPDHCKKNTPAQKCNALLPNCNIPSAPTCDSTYTVVQGDDAYTIATLNGLTLLDLEAMNPSVDFTISLQPNQVLCLHQTVPTTAECEGRKISG